MKYVERAACFLLGVFLGVFFLWTPLHLSFKNPRTEYSKAIDLKQKNIFGCVYVPNHSEYGPVGWSYCAEPGELVEDSEGLEKFLEKHQKDLGIDSQAGKDSI